MSDAERFLARHADLTRRFFLRAGAAWAVTGYARADARADSPPPELASAIEKRESYFTPPDEFQAVPGGKPRRHSIPEEKRREVGLTRDTWRLEVVADPEHPAPLRKPLTRKDGTALDFDGLVKFGERHAVRFAKVMTCLNI